MVNPLANFYEGTDLVEKIIQNKESLMETKQEQEVILFFSFDVVNSSLYKTINYYNWSTVLIRLFEKIKTSISFEIPNAELWRILGDEEIFIVRINNEDDISSYINKIYSTLISFSNDLKNGTFFDQFQNTQNFDSNLMRLQNVISLKAASWIAIVTDLSEYSNDSCIEEFDNIFVKYDSNYTIFDFLGNDIDAGFRISKETCERRLVLSFELAYLLADTVPNFLNIITYKKLKGVWKNRLYPVIWYYDPKKHNQVDFKDSFYYDEHESNTLVEEYLLNQSKSSSENTNIDHSEDVNRVFKKILQDQNLSSKIEKINSTIHFTDNSIYTHIDKNLLELHCAVVCFNKTTKQIMIAKRSASRSHYPSFWEFGCAKGNLQEDLAESLVKEYKQDFDMDIKPVLDTTRSDSEPIPIALYKMEKGRAKHKGLITLAEILSPEKVYHFKPTKKHEELKWITEDELSSFSEKSIPDFISTLELAFKTIENLREE